MDASFHCPLKIAAACSGSTLPPETMTATPRPVVLVDAGGLAPAGHPRPIREDTSVFRLLRKLLSRRPGAGRRETTRRGEAPTVITVC